MKHTVNMGSHQRRNWLSLHREFFCQSIDNSDNESLRSINGCTDINLVCCGGDKVSWSGLPYLATLSKLFRHAAARSGGSEATIFMPDYDEAVVTKLIMLLTQGSVMVEASEVAGIQEVMVAVGVITLQELHHFLR